MNAFIIFIKTANDVEFNVIFVLYLILYSSIYCNSVR